MSARFDENPAMTLQDIKETQHYGRTHGRTDGRMDNVKTVYPPQTKFAGGIKSDYMHVLNSIEHEIYHAPNVKMPTIVGILTFISMINTTSDNLKARKVYFSAF